MSDQPTARRATTVDIARSAGVSRTTVAFVLNDTPGQTISKATRERVLAEADRLGYRPHPAARALASGRSRMVLLVLPDWPLDFNLRRNIEEASLALDEAGYSLITYTPHPTGQSRPLWEILQPDVVVSLMPLTRTQVAGIRRVGIEHVIPDPDHPAEEEYPEEGPVLQVRHLADLGHNRIAYAGSADPRVVDLVGLRRTRVLGAAAACGMSGVVARDIELTDASAGAAIGDWLEEGVSAVAAYNDDVAATVVGAALRLGLSVPGDLAVIGHDDTPLASMFQPTLSTVRINTAGLGRYLAALTLSTLEAGEVPTVGPELSARLIVRASSGPG